MARRTFKGGVHPPTHKELTEEKPIESLPMPERVIVPLKQHLGAPAEPIVERGAKVNEGDKIAEAKGFVSVPAHSPISGTVVSVEPVPHPFGGEELAVIIQADGEGALNEEIQFDDDYLDLSPDEMKDRVREAGLAGMGGAAFPTHVKLSPPEDKPIDTLIINGAECEPYLTADHRLMVEQGEDIIKGLRIFQKILGGPRAIVAIEGNKPDAIEAMKGWVLEDGDIAVVSLKVKYPQGSEKQLIKALTGREVPSGGLPMDVGCLVQNVGTAKAVYDAVAFRKPLTERVVTVTGRGVADPKNVRAKIGTPFKELIDYCGGYRENGPLKVIMGGPLMGLAQADDRVPVIKGTSGILVLPEKDSRLGTPRPCISCSRCVDVCPAGLVPSFLGSYVEYEQWETAEGIGIMDCIECGCCTYVCPTKRNLVHLIKYGKQIVLSSRAN